MTNDEAGKKHRTRHGAIGNKNLSLWMSAVEVGRRDTGEHQLFQEQCTQRGRGIQAFFISFGPKPPLYPGGVSFIPEILTSFGRRTDLH